MLCCNVVLRNKLLNIDCDTMMDCLDRNNEKCSSRYQKIIIVKELEKIGEMYLGHKKTIISDDIFIVTNIRIDYQMNAVGF